jgi:hypothetical protein
MSQEIQKMPSMLSIYRRAIVKKRDPGFKVGDSLPDLALKLARLPINSKHLSAYNRACGFASSDCVAATYPQILAFPLQLEMLVGKRFPFPLLGLVHIANRIEVLKPIDKKAVLAIAVSLGEQRIVDKGVEIDVLTSIAVDGDEVWRGVATMLARCHTGVEKRPSDKQAAKPLGSNRQLWNLPAGLGRRYGKASGDLNPIHLFATTAKLFGFKRAIAHGMWSKAKVLSTLDGQLPAAPYCVDVRFKLPIFLPAQVQFTYLPDAENKSLSFELWDKRGEKPHLSGSIEPSDSAI